LYRYYSDREKAMKIMITGSKGMLGSQVVKILSQNSSWEIIGVSRKDFDITVREESYGSIHRIRPDVVIHTAAYTDVDGCEKDWKRAYTANGIGTRYIALACRDSGAKMIYISTDYIFNGRKKEPYLPDELPDPLNEYGNSKLLGEFHIQELLEDYLIIRSAWLFGPGGKNFVEKILKAADCGEKLRVVHDQIGTPTYTLDLAEAIASLVKIQARGIVHVTNQNYCSRYEQAQEIIRQTGRENVEIIPIATAETDRPAPRPAYSVLDNSLYIEFTQKPLPHWQDALQHYLKALEYA
jgi:dTDP-4-dehydrorhamnose reductase